MKELLFFVLLILSFFSCNEHKEINVDSTDNSFIEFRNSVNNIVTTLITDNQLTGASDDYAHIEFLVSDNVVGNTITFDLHIESHYDFTAIFSVNQEDADEWRIHSLIETGTNNFNVVMKNSAQIACCIAQEEVVCLLPSGDPIGCDACFDPENPKKCIIITTYNEMVTNG
ncbi:MAG: hypothetical protein MI974_05615 [Chitinophagales bacterium]|nr:hypothetical protein [Chitinophagales bacterium]